MKGSLEPRSIGADSGGDSPPRELNIARLPPPRKNAAIVAEQIRRMIIVGELNEGDHLLPESQLLGRFGVSRPTLREAIRVLENEGLISVGRGDRKGAKVHKPRVETTAQYAGFTLQADGATLEDVYIAQAAVEPSAARMLAADAKHRAQTAAFLRRYVADLEAAFNKMEWAEYAVMLTRFHLIMVEQTGNKTLRLVAAIINMVLEKHHVMFRASEFKGVPNAPEFDKYRQRGPRSIAKLIKLIEAGDADAAEAHWREHCQNAAKHWLGQVDEGRMLEVL